MGLEPLRLRAVRPVVQQIGGAASDEVDVLIVESGGQIVELGLEEVEHVRVGARVGGPPEQEAQLRRAGHGGIDRLTLVPDGERAEERRQPDGRVARDPSVPPATLRTVAARPERE